MIIRMFDTAVDPEDIERARALFREQARPAFEAFEGCHGIDMYLGTTAMGDLVDLVAISRWETQPQVDAAVSSDSYSEALAELKGLFQRTPIVRHFEASE